MCQDHPLTVLLLKGLHVLPVTEEATMGGGRGNTRLLSLSQAYTEAGTKEVRGAHGGHLISNGRKGDREAWSTAVHGVTKSQPRVDN